MELQTVKDMLGIKSSQHDAYILTMIPVMQEVAERECHQTFGDTPPAGVQLYIAKTIEFNMGDSGLKARSMGEVSYTYNTEMPESIASLLRPYKRIRIR